MIDPVSTRIVVEVDLTATPEEVERLRKALEDSAWMVAGRYSRTAHVKFVQANEEARK